MHYECIWSLPGDLHLNDSLEDLKKKQKNATMEMIYDLQEAFHDTLLENDWLDNSTKTFAIDKASQMLAKIAYPDFILDDTKLDNYYSGLSIKESDSYSQMRDELNRWNNDFEYKRLVKPVDRNEFRFNPTSVNAYYDVFTNSIKFPAAILQAPFFHKYFPKALNYGGIGVVIGHEMTHGFDDGGSQHDAVGNLRNWWSAGVQKEFLKRAQCIVDQYGRIKVPETGQLLNGRLTQGENIADNGGVKVAFKIWCGDETRESLSANILTDTHAPHKYRVNRVLANRPEFAAAFNCAVGTPMNPTTDRCAVW
ncbi:hypothetical protein KIN20_016737 [Parelaphostrongylus tenuis]|uniref:Peptidase M13 C-terminal domain-containing protein n=1 Tax=Parelaphostrongylus tenuis TaxID=148309 RepID=A0AAD5QQZ7_PARTN|nr:hypothetical protein KIN20_016737 [Parelaphostrongylus tenuis]